MAKAPPSVSLNAIQEMQAPVNQPIETAVCGIVMPISAIDGCNESHWGDVLTLVSEAIEDAGFRPNIVSNADESGIIQKRIIQNLFDNPIVVCDVSGKNPNVMFELGMRLAFDKPTIVIKDDRTDYSFDTSPIEHLGYPRDLRFSKIIEFKARLSEKIVATTKAASDQPNYTTFLKHFGEFKIAQIDQKEVGPEEFMLEELREMRMILRRLQFESKRDSRPLRYGRPDDLDFCLSGMSKDVAESFLEKTRPVLGENAHGRILKVDDHFHLEIAGEMISPARHHRIRAMLRNEEFHRVEN